MTWRCTRTVGQFPPFDLMVVILLSEAVSNPLSGQDNSMIGCLIVAATLIALNMILAHVSSHSERIESLIEGHAVLVARDGKIFDKQMRKHRVGRADVHKALREADCELENVRCAFLETDGSISIMTRKDGGGDAR